MNTKKLGFGMMRLPLFDRNDPTSLDIEQIKKMVDLFIEKGFTYFDTAWMYHNFCSEKTVKECLVSRHPRESFTLATKLHSDFLKGKEDRDRIFEQQRENTGVSYFDYYLLHDVNHAHYQAYRELDCFSWIADKKEKGLIKEMGFSFHANAELLDKVLTEHPEFDFVQLQINYLDWENVGIQSRRCHEVAVKHGKKIIVMEPVKGGTLARLPDSLAELLTHRSPELSVPSWAIRFAASLENVMVVLSGMSNVEQLLDNTSYMADFKPLSPEERKLVESVAESINSDTAIACTGCAYCTSGCPQSIAIPQYFSLYNSDLQESKRKKGWHPQSQYYNTLAQAFGSAGDCIACGQCEGICPQHLPIIDYLKTVSEYFGK